MQYVQCSTIFTPSLPVLCMMNVGLGCYRFEGVYNSDVAFYFSSNALCHLSVRLYVGVLGLVCRGGAVNGCSWCKSVLKIKFRVGSLLS